MFLLRLNCRIEKVKSDHDSQLSYENFRHILAFVHLVQSDHATLLRLYYFR